MTYERIQEMRRLHANGCTNPPEKEPKVPIKRLSKLMERARIESADEVFRFSFVNLVTRRKVLPVSNNSRVD